MTIPPELREAKKLTKQSFDEAVNTYIHKTPMELEMIAADVTTPALDQIVISMIVQAGKQGDYTRLNFLLERTIGKVKTIVEVGGSMGLGEAFSEDQATRIAERLIARKRG